MDKFDKFKGQLQDIVRDLKPPGLKFMKELKEFDNLIKVRSHEWVSDMHH